MQLGSAALWLGDGAPEETAQVGSPAVGCRRNLDTVERRVDGVLTIGQAGLRGVGRRWCSDVCERMRFGENVVLQRCAGGSRRRCDVGEESGLQWVGYFGHGQPTGGKTGAVVRRNHERNVGNAADDREAAIDELKLDEAIVAFNLTPGRNCRFDLSGAIARSGSQGSRRGGGIRQRTAAGVCKRRDGKRHTFS